MVASKVATRFGTVRTVSTALAATVPFWLLFTVAPTFQVLSIVYLFRMAIASVCNPLMPAFFYRIIYEDEKATANSLTTTSSMLSNIIAPKLGGYMMENIHIESTAVMGAALYGLYSASFFFLMRNEKPKNGESIPLD
jgi:predicted MFS family arabinose efflux permease